MLAQIAKMEADDIKKHPEKYRKTQQEADIEAYNHIRSEEFEKAAEARKDLDNHDVRREIHRLTDKRFEEQFGRKAPIDYHDD